MQIVSIRDFFCPTATLSRLLINGKDTAYMVDGVPHGLFTCEDVDRGLKASDPLEHIRRMKVQGRTAIPTTGLWVDGKQINESPPYKVGIRFSPKAGREVLWLPEVPGFQFINFHAGNTEEDTDGCQVLGTVREVSPRYRVLNSIAAMKWWDTHEAGPMAAVRADPDKIVNPDGSIVSKAVTFAVLRGPVNQ